jgi:drug/metabolite transporter (DMT)-like permease
LRQRICGQAMTNPMQITPEKQRWSGTTWLELVAIVLFWSANWPITKSILVYASPMAFTAIRFICALLVMGIVSAFARLPFMPVNGERSGLGLIGLLQIGGMLGFSFAGLQYLGPGRAAVLTYTMPIWCIPLGWLLTRDRINWSGVMGGALGLAGLLVFLNPALINWSDHSLLLGNGLALAGALCWALGACLYRRRRWQTGFWTQTFWQVLASTVVLSLPLWLLGARRPIVWTASLVAVLAYNAVVTTALCYWWWGKVLATTSASRAGQFLTLVPVCALLMSKAFSGEAVGLPALASVVLISSGVVVTLRGRSVAAPVLTKEDGC